MPFMADKPNLITVETNALALTFYPDAGGRLLSIRYAGAEILWINPALFGLDMNLKIARSQWPEPDETYASWVNPGGSKTWPAPQEEWAGPPDPVLDTGIWAVESSYDDSRAMHRIWMQSEADIRSGLQVTREFEIPDHGSKFTQRTSFHNHSDRPRKWSIWEVCQVATAGMHVYEVDVAGIDIEVAGDGSSVDLGQYVNEVTERRAPGKISVPITETIGKRGYPEATGRATFRRPDGISLSLTTDIDEGATYPDRGSRVEVWLQAPMDAPVPGLPDFQPDSWLAELEVLSPLRTIEPGETIEMHLEWLVERG